MMAVLRGVLALCVLVAPGRTAADAAARPAPPSPSIAAPALPADGAIVVDGHFDEPAWERVAVITEFVQREPSEGAAPSQRTEVRIIHDAEALYVAVRAYDDEPDRIVGLLTRRDQRSPSDWIRIVVDSYFDRRTAYEFGVNPVGVKLDRYYYNDGSVDESWDAVWDVQVGRDELGWRAEFRIPYSQLRFSSTTGGPIGFAVIREIGRLAETSTWPLIARSVNGFVSQFAELQGVRLSSSPKRLEWLPYSVGRVRFAPEDHNPLTRDATLGGAAGLDLKYALHPGLTVTATVNPDFGQVEADPAVVNLDAFETFFPERRPFFIEGSGIFRFNVDCSDGSCTGLFYSRRVGRAPQGRADTATGEQSAAPDAATIYGAAKLTGRVGHSSVGALFALTSEESATVLGSTGRRSQVVEPRTGYSVVRARREFANQSNVGVMLTSTNRHLVDSVAFLPSNALTGGVDYDLRPGRRYSISGYWAGSHLTGGPDAMQRLQQNAVHGFQRPDADHVAVDEAATSLAGHAGAIAFGKIGGERTRFSANYGYKTPGFDINDLGYQRRADERTISHWFQLRRAVPGRFVRSRNINVNQWAGWNFGGDRLWSGGNVNMHWTWANYYSTGFGINVNDAPLRDRVTRGGPAVLGNPSLSLWYYAGTDTRRALSFSWDGHHEADRHRSIRHSMVPWVTWRPATNVSFSTGFRYRVNDDDAQWVENVTDGTGITHYVFGRLTQRTSSFTVRTNYTLAPTLSVQIYAEPFVSSGKYSGFKELADGRAAAYDDRYRPFEYGGAHDFNYRSFRTTNVLRWEYRPGCTLFLVWQQGREEQTSQGDFRFGRDFGGALSAPSTNVVLLKLSYWINR